MVQLLFCDPAGKQCVVQKGELDELDAFANLEMWKLEGSGEGESGEEQMIPLLQLHVQGYPFASVFGHRRCSVPTT